VRATQLKKSIERTKNAGALLHWLLAAKPQQDEQEKKEPKAPRRPVGDAGPARIFAQRADETNRARSGGHHVRPRRARLCELL